MQSVPKHPNPASEELLERIQAGDTAALKQLMERYWEPLVRYARTLLPLEDAAEDIAQEAFVRFWERRDRWEARASLETLLFCIARNLALNEKKHQRIRTRHADRAAERARPPTPLEVVQGTEVQRAVDRAVEALPARRREVFLLARVQGLSYREIAAVTGVTPQTVANQMSAALAQLREALSRFFDTSTAGVLILAFAVAPNGISGPLVC